MRSTIVRKITVLSLVVLCTHLAVSKLVERYIHARQVPGTTRAVKESVSPPTRAEDGLLPDKALRVDQNLANVNLISSHSLRIVDFSMKGNLVHLIAEAKIQFDQRDDTYVFGLAVYNDNKLENMIWKDVYPDTVFQAPLGGSNACRFDKFIKLPLESGNYPLILSLHTVPKDQGLEGLAVGRAFTQNRVSYVGKEIS